MITAHEYREMAEQCFGWACEAQTDAPVLRQPRPNLVGSSPLDRIRLPPFQATRILSS